MKRAELTVYEDGRVTFSRYYGGEKSAEINLAADTPEAADCAALLDGVEGVVAEAIGREAPERRYPAPEERETREDRGGHQ